MGRNGPAFITYPNFDVYLEWNQSLVYSTTAAYYATRADLKNDWWSAAPAGAAMRALAPPLLALTLTGCSGEPSPSRSASRSACRRHVQGAARSRARRRRDGAGRPAGPRVTCWTASTTSSAPGQSGKSAERPGAPTTPRRGVRFADLGTGYWMVAHRRARSRPPGELTWAFTSTSPATRRRASTRCCSRRSTRTATRATQTRPRRAASPAPIPDNLNACDPTIAPPAAVLSLAWDADVDLDLVVVAPRRSGRRSQAPHDRAEGVDGGVTPEPGEGRASSIATPTPAAPSIDVRRENLVWQARPGDGHVPRLRQPLLGVRAAVGALHRCRSRRRGHRRRHTGRSSSKLSASGELLAIDANGGATLGLYVTDVLVH